MVFTRLYPFRIYCTLIMKSFRPITIKSELTRTYAYISFLCLIVCRSWPLEFHNCALVLRTPANIFSYGAMSSISSWSLHANRFVIVGFLPLLCPINIILYLSFRRVFQSDTLSLSPASVRDFETFYKNSGFCSPGQENIHIYLCQYIIAKMYDSFEKRASNSAVFWLVVLF